MQRIREITFFKTESGRYPVVEFIESMSQRKERAKIVKVFEAVETMQSISTHFFKKMQGTKDLWEIRVHGFRFLGFYDDRKFVVVHAFSKQSMKTPKHEIDVARARLQAYRGQQNLL